jgi:hypothetical protein
VTPRFACLCLALCWGCTSARTTATIDGEPLCADFELGAARTPFKGALKNPVKVTVLDGKTVVSERVVLGKRHDSDPNAIVVVQDTNETYTIRFAQCENAFAAQPVAATANKPRDNKDEPKRQDDRTAYECGDSKVYKEIQLEVKRGKKETRVIPWQPPPDAECLTSRVPTAPAASAPR